ncbi:peptidase family C50-domain-containing protein [Gaertneriomyces semiglobifer]|nr:peptidase family C50-domain-containing protein [Gaertneriomyces semiglobifer]
MSPEDFERDIVSKLPAEWLVCSISVDLEREDLYITRYENGNAPVVVRLPLQRQGLREGEDGGSTYSEIVSELQNILQESNAMMKNAASYVTLDDKKGWWSTRRTLDGRLKSLMRQVEMGWLGAFKGLLTSDDFDSPDLQNAVETFKKAIEKNISGAVGTKARRSKRPPVFTVEDSICRMLLRLGSSPAYEDVEDALYYLLDAYQYSGAGIDYDELDIDGMESDFRDALQAFYSVYTHRQAENTPEMSGKHTILILDKHLHMIPWESLPALRSTPIVRLPSIFSLRDTLATRANTRLTLDQSNAYYILNPSKDLKATQEEFMPFVKSRQQWSGLVGECPKEDDIAAALATKDLFIYFGHGGGEQYVRGQRVRELDRAAMALLLGCSSGCLTPTGEFDPYGTPLNYLLGGSPAIVANLWDVTDKDIDRFSKKMLQEWGLMDSASSCLPGERSIAEAVAAAREVCKLEYLTGAAPVVYGLPVFLSARKMECEPQA